MTSTFSATVADWCEEVEGATEAVFKESVQELIRIAQTPKKSGGRMPIDTGFLRASLLGSTSMMPTIDPTAFPPDDAAPNSIPYTGEEITTVIISHQLGTPLYFGWTAAYAAYREYGANNIPPDAFMRTAAQQWPQIVAAKEAELMGRLGL